MIRRVLAAAAAVAAVAGLTAACGRVDAAPTPAPTTVDLLYAASLGPFVARLGPVAARRGLRLSGVAGGSDALVSQVLGGVRPADVLVSASPAPLARLHGAAHGAGWDVRFAASPLVLGYDPRSRFAARLRAGPWATVVTGPGFRLGRTDPALDPSGALAVAAVHQAAAAHPGVLAVLRDPADVFPEESLLGRLQAGQLDAAFLYRSEAVAAGVPYVSLGRAAPAATYALTLPAGGPHPAAALHLAELLLGPTGRALERRAGLAVAAPATVDGSGLPAPLRRVLAR